MTETAQHPTTARVTLPAGIIREALRGFAKLGLRNAKLPVLKMIAVSRCGGAVTLRATDLDNTLVYSAGQDGGQDCQFLVPYETLNGAIRRIAAGAAISVDADGTIVIDDGALTSTAAFTTCPVKDFPDPPNPSGESGQLEPAAMEALLQARGYASEDVNREILRGILISAKGIVATDGRRLYHAKGTIPPCGEGLLIPAAKTLDLFSPKTAAQLSRTGSDTSTGSILEQGPWQWHFKGIEGNYPNWQQVVPDPSKWTARLVLSDTDITLMERIASLDALRADHSPVTLQADGGAVSLITSTGQNPETRPLAPLSFTVNGAPEPVSFNFTYLLDAIRAGFRTIQWTGAHGPIVAVANKRTALFMPLRDADPKEEGGKDKPAPVKAEVTVAKAAKPAEAPGKATDAPAKPAPEPKAAPAPAAAAMAAEDTPDPALARLVREAGDLREILRSAVTGLGALIQLGREANREHGAVEKELSQLRRNLRSLKKLSA